MKLSNPVDAAFLAICKIASKEEPITNKKEQIQAQLQLRAISELNRRDAIAASLKKTEVDNKKVAMEFGKTQADLYKFKFKNNIVTKKDENTD